MSKNKTKCISVSAFHQTEWRQSKLNNLLFALILIGTIFNHFACKKFVDVGAPVSSMNSENVYTNDATAAAVLTGIYINLSMADIGVGESITSITSKAGLSSDELIQNGTDPTLNAYYTNDLLSTTPTIWQALYSNIFTVNSAIEGLTASTSLTFEVKQQLLGEALFIRAFCYFYLVNLYGDIPLATTTDFKMNSMLSRTDKSLIYKQIIDDLIESKTLLNEDYVNGIIVAISDERVRPSKGSATALLARVYLYAKEYAKAEIEATIIINNTTLYDTVPLNEVFLKNSKEAIWQLQPVGTATASNTKEGQFFIPPSTSTTGPETYVSNDLIQSFEAGDKRKANWVMEYINNGIHYYPYKYKIGAIDSDIVEYSMVLRVAEQYLIRAEARAEKGNLADAATDLNIIRKRAGLANTTAVTSQDLLNAIYNERRVELFAEWGHRWLDLKRSGRVNSILQIAKGNAWQDTDQLYPIPQYDIDQNPNLQGHQNPGYN